MPKALFKGTVIAEAETVEVIEGNLYFPPDAIDWTYLTDSQTTTVCPWKGEASYYSITVDADTETDAAWTYHDPKAAAAAIKDHVAFWKRVVVEE